MKRDEIGFPRFQSIIDVFLNTVKIHPQNLFLRMREIEEVLAYTYEMAAERIGKLAQYLKQNGFVPDQRAAILGRNCPEWIFSYLAVMWAGGVVVPLDCRGRATEWAHLMRHSECGFVFCASEFYDDLLEVRETISTLDQIIPFSQEVCELSLPYIFDAFEKISQPESRSRQDVAVILYTSGTTGCSKGVVLTHGNLLANLEQVLLALDVSENDRFFSVLPLHHCFEATCGFLLPLMEGAAITFAVSLRSKDLLRDLRETRPTVFLAVPLLLDKLHQGLMKNLKNSTPLKKGIFHTLKTLAKACDVFLKGAASKKLLYGVRAAMGLNELRYLISGGAALSRKLSREYELLGFPILQGYGLTETSPVLSVNLPEECRNESVGRPLPGIMVKILDPNPEGIGEIAVRGPSVTKEYYRNEEATNEAFHEGWFHTGDLGTIDESGFLYVTGRRKSLIVTRGGKNISPEEIEEELLKSPFIKECLVLARIHPRTKNEEVHAIIYPDFERIDEYALEQKLAKEEKVTRDLIQIHIECANGLLAEYKRIRSFSIRGEEFPKTTTEKIKRYLFEEGGIEIKGREVP